MRSRQCSRDSDSLPRYTSQSTGQSAGEESSSESNPNKYHKIKRWKNPLHYHYEDDDDDYPPCCCCQSRRVLLGTAFGFLLSCAIVFLATNQSANASVLQTLDQETVADFPTAFNISEPPVRKWAYAFFLGGVPTLRNNQTAQSHAGYKGLLYNILVSASILRESGSRADLILMVHTQEPYASLPPKDARMLQQLNVTTYYVPPTLPSFENGLSTIALEKFRILDWLRYSRVLYLEGDVMPHCNLDYLFELSEPQNTTREPLLQENVIMSVAGIPATTSVFLLKPWRGHYQRFLRIFGDYPDYFEQFNQTKGWGRPFKGKEKDDVWLSVADIQSPSLKKVRDKWNFQGADLDRGLLYHYVRYIRKKVSIIVGPRVLQVTGNEHKRVANPLIPHSCLPSQEERVGGRGNQWYADAKLKKTASPFGQAPYRDFAQWEHNENKPWNYAKAPDVGMGAQTARQRWFEVLRKLDEKHQWNLGLYKPNQAPPKEPEAESLDAEVPNWKYVPRQKPTNLIPIWSTKVHALKQWAKQQTDSETRERSWQPPLLTLPPDAHRQHLFSTSRTEQQSTPSNNGKTIQPIPCNCSTPIQVDPCSLPDRSIEDWLKPRLGLQFSKHRPACPGGARHHMHVVLPFANLELDTIQAAYCSVQCQNYPSDRMSIYLYEDGAGDSKQASKVLPQICGEKSVMEVIPPVASSQASSDTRSDEEFDAASQKWAQETMTRYSLGIEPKKRAMVSNTLCLHSNEHSGPGGGKYWAFNLVQARAQANDIVVVVDGDDELNTPQALTIMNERYVKKSAWMTYGSYSGKYSEQTKAMPRTVLQGTSPFNPRQDQPTWRFGHTRSFKAHLLRHLGRRDFALKDNSWLVKATDRGFVYRVLELSGSDRVEFIPEALYKYKWDATSSTGASVPKEIKVANLQHVQSLEPSQRMTLPIHIVVVCWSRVYLLKHQLVWLQEQTLAQNRQLVIHLISNNPQTHPGVISAVEKFKNLQDGESFTNNIPIQVKVVKQSHNWHAFSRFLFIHELRKTEPMDLAIFVDDDQYWVPNFLTSLLSHHDSGGMTTWYGKTFTTKDFFTDMADYWSSDITWSHIATRNKTDIATFTYGGPGGSVFDTNIWLFNQQLLRLRHDLQQYYEFDDVWASYVIDALLGWEHRRLPFPLPVDIANMNKPLYDRYILPSLPAGQADKLIEMHQEMAQNLKAVATFSGSSRGSKTDMFLDMQQKFRWDVLRPIDAPLAKPSNDDKAKQIGVSPFVPRQVQKKSKRAFVCITGQFDRLELENKVTNFLAPIISQGYKVQLALVLSGGETSFTNEGYSKLAQYQPKDQTPFYKSISEAVEVLQQNGVNVISPKDVTHGTYEKLANPKIHQQYLLGLYKMQQGARSFDQQTERAKNHPRIWESYQRCLAYAEKAVSNANEKAVLKDPNAANHPYTLATYYDVFFRIREDVGFQNKLSTTMLTSLVEPPPGSVTVSGCRGWHGMNDRFASVSPDVAHTYFQRPYQIFQKEEPLQDQSVFNPETFLLDAYLSSGIKVFANKALKGIYRMYKNAKTGQAEFHQDDLQKEWCLKPMNHTHHVAGLYGWDVVSTLP